jgi:hypothetical protein
LPAKTLRRGINSWEDDSGSNLLSVAATDNYQGNALFTVPIIVENSPPVAVSPGPQLLKLSENRKIND